MEDRRITTAESMMAFAKELMTYTHPGKRHEYVESYIASLPVAPLLLPDIQCFILLHDAQEWSRCTAEIACANDCPGEVPLTDKARIMFRDSPHLTALELVFNAGVQIRIERVVHVPELPVGD